MKKVIVLSLAVMILSQPLIYADEQSTSSSGDAGVFLTLTRTPYPAQDLPNDTQIITPQEFQKFDAQNAGEAIAHATSIQLLPTGGSGTALTVRTRGSLSDQTLVLIDGRPVEGVSLGTPDLSEIPTENIDHIEILRGGVSALYGPNAMGGVVNVITKRGATAPSADLDVETRSFDGEIQRLSVGSKAGPVDYFVYGNHQTDSGFRDDSDSKINNAGGNVGVSMGAAGKLMFDASEFHANLDVPGMIFPDIPTNQFNNQIEKQASTPGAQQITDTKYLRTSYELPLPQSSKLTLNLFGSQREVDYSDPNFVVDSDRFEQSKGADAQVQLPLGLLVGGNFIHDRENSIDNITPENTFTRSIDSWGIFAQDTMAWRFLKLIPSGRFDHHSQFGDTANPRVELIADANAWLQFSGSVARSFRAPTLDDLYYHDSFFTGNPNLLPEHSWSYDSGFKLHHENQSLKITYYRVNTANLIQDTEDFSTDVNVGAARRQGMEVEIDDKLNEMLGNSFNYTYLDNVGIPPGYDHYVPLSYSPRHVVNDTVSWSPWKSWEFDNTWRYEDSRYTGNDLTGTKLGSELIWDLKLSYSFTKTKLYFGVNDINNKRYEEQSGFPLPGRTFFGGLTVKLWD